jgi:microcystin-dependent protein
MTYLSGRTPVLGLPYSTPDDDVDVAQEEQAMMEAIESMMLTRIFVIGEMRIFAGGPPDAKWLQVLGQILNRSDYPELAAKLDTTWNTGGETAAQFRLPTTNGRALVGAGPAQTGVTARPVATRWGVEAIALSVAQLPSHNHTLHDPGHAHSVYDPGHNHAVSSSIPDFSMSIGGGGVGMLSDNAGAPWRYNAPISIGLAGTGISLYGSGTGVYIDAVGGTQNHDNTQPSLAVPVYIYAGR